MERDSNSGAQERNGISVITLYFLKEALIETLIDEIKRQLSPQTSPAVQGDVNPPLRERVLGSRYTPSPQ